MKLITLAVLAVILSLATSLPWKSQIALLNSLEVGRNEEPMDWTCFGCDQSNKPLTSTIIEHRKFDVKAILSVYEEYTVLAFRYTATLKNVAQDIMWAFQVQDQNAPQGCKVQKFFDKMWNKIRDETLQGLKKSVHTGRLIITGISLGGALSCLSYVDIAQSNIFQNIEIITFGAPRVGNRNWAAWFDQITKSTRYFIKADPIAFLPRCLTLICNYKQTGQAYKCNKVAQTCTYIDKNSEEQESGVNDTNYFTDLAESVADHLQEQDNVDGIIDHIYGYKKIRKYTQIN